MNPRYKPFVWTGVAIATGLLLILVLRGLGGERTDSPAVDATSVQAQADMTDAGPSPSAPPTFADTPPWARDQTGGQLSITDPVTGLPAAATAQLPTAAETAAAIATIRQQSQHNVQTVDGLMRKLDELEATGNVPADVKLDALRDNLNVAKRAQLLALELAESTQQPETPQREQRTAQIVAELQELQGRVRHDVTAGAVPGMVPGAGQGP